MRTRRRTGLLRGLLLGGFWLVQLVVAVVVHLGTGSARRVLEDWVSGYVSREIRGTIQLGRIERLSATSLWLEGTVLYDEQNRRVLTLEHARLRSEPLGALWRWMTRNEPLTLILEALQADAIHLKLHPDPLTREPSVLRAIEPDPRRAPATPGAPSSPFRVFLPQVDLEDVIVDSTFPSLSAASLRLRKVSGQLLVTQDGVAVSLRRFGLDLVGATPVPVHVFGGVEFRTPDRIWGDVHAVVGEVPMSIHAQYEHDQLELRVQALKIQPAAARSVVPSWPLVTPLGATLTATGPVSRLAVRLDLTTEGGRLQTSGTVAHGAIWSADLESEATALDLDKLFGIGASTALDASARTAITLEDGAPRAQLRGKVKRGRIQAFASPPIELEGRFDPEGMLLSGRSCDPNVPIRAAVMMKAEEFQIDAQSAKLDLSRLPGQGLASDLRGQLEVKASALVSHGETKLDLDANVSNLVYGALRTRQVKIVAKAEGPTEAPRRWNGQARFDIASLTTPIIGFEQVTVTATGKPEKSHLSLQAQSPGAARIEAALDLLPLDGLVLRNARLELRRGASAAKLRADSVSLQDSAWLVRDLVLDGAAGNAVGSLSVRGEQVFAQVRAETLDLGVIGDLLGLDPGFVSGRLDGTLDLDTRRAPATGRAEWRFERTRVGAMTNLSGELESSLEGTQLTGRTKASSDLVDDLSVNFDVGLGGSPTRLRSYERATGTVAVDLGRVRLDRIGTLLGLIGSNVSVTGTADLRLAAERDTPDEPANLVVNAATDGLQLSLPAGSKRVKLDHFALQLNGNYRGSSGSLRTDLVLSRYGLPKATLGVTADTPRLEELLADPSAVRAAWRDAPFEAFLYLPKQSITELGDLLGEPLGSGEAELKVWLKGPLADARLVTELQGQRLLLTPFGVVQAFDLQGLVEYTKRSGEARMTLAAGAADPWLQVNGSVTLLPCAEPLSCVADWSGGVEVGLLGLPLEALPALAPLGFSGIARGVVAANRSAGTTTVNGVVPVDQFRISGNPLGQTLLHVRGDNGLLVAGAKLIDGGAQLDVEAQMPTDWRHLLPSRRRDAPTRIVAHATGYDAGIASPWLQEYLTNLGGELNGTVEATIESPADGNTDEPSVAIGGNLQLTAGKATLKDFGLDVSDLTLSAQASSTASRTTISVPNFSGSVGEGTNNVVGSLVLELRGTKLERLAARLSKAQGIPLQVNAVNLGTLSGSANVEMTPKGDWLDVGVDFDSVEVALPRTGTRQVQGLGENTDIVVLQPLGSAEWRKARSAQGTKMRVRIALGKKSRVTRSDMNVPITGTPVVEIAEQVRPSGEIQLEPGGRLELFGKAFVVDRGRITLDPDQPSNPRLDVVANWRGPTHLVTVQIQGKREEARLRLTSDPPLASESQVLALLLGGGTGDDSARSAGLGVGATLFNEILSDTALSNLEVRTSTDARHANYTAAVPIRENLWFEATYQSPSNTNLAGSAAQRGFSGTVDYRFRRNWSIRTEVGTLGAGADLLWQYRY